MSMHQDTELLRPAEHVAALDDLELTAERAEEVKGGAEPTNERKSPIAPPASLNHNETVLAGGRAA